MKLPRLRTVLLAPLVLFIVFYLFGVVANLLDDRQAEPLSNAKFDSVGEIAVFGASGTAGDGILKAALADPSVNTIHVITRRVTPRIEAGAASGKVVMTKHMDYLDYSAVQNQFQDVKAVYWALGTSSRNVDDETYSVIHVDFPVQFLKVWLQVSRLPNIRFHYISSSDISEDSSMHWAREKVRAEKELFALANGTKLSVIAYRPDYIGPTEEESQLGQELLYWFFAPVRAAVRAQQIGEAMLEVTVRGDEFENGDILGTASILRHSDAYRRRQ
jgi:nucleoside-diphosphate-sugar epimerase